MLTFTAALSLAAFAWGAGPANTPAQKKASARKAAPAVAVRRASATAPGRTAAGHASAVRKPGASTAAAARRTTTKAPARPVTTWRNRQTTPSADRYKAIQDALVLQGYLPTEEATGNWNQASADALKKFQADQTLESTGKINSLSLIALGLGPRHDSTIPHPVDGNYAMPESSRN